VPGGDLVDLDKRKEIMSKHLVKTSKFLSLVLRHNPSAAYLELDKNGWASVTELLKGAKRAGIDLNRDLLEEVVAENNKKRFTFNDDGTKIRANQGHSVIVDLGLPTAVPPTILYHGTTTKFKDSIFKQGLMKRKRQHVHLSSDIDTALTVGGRHGRPIVLKVQAALMNADGYKFYLSKNGVWLTDHVPSKYIGL
jgi:putative RNA 2'-phosphotransferase